MATIRKREKSAGARRTAKATKHPRLPAVRRRVNASKQAVADQRREKNVAVIRRTVWFGGFAMFAGLILFAAVLTLFFVPQSAASRFSELDPWRSSRSNCAAQSGTYENGFCFPATEAACKAIGGQWLLLGGITGYGCTRVAPDAGQACTDNRQCSSEHCLGILTVPIRQQLSLNPTDGVPTAGVCAGFLRVFSCVAKVNDGRVRTLSCRQ